MTMSIVSIKSFIFSVSIFGNTEASLSGKNQKEKREGGAFNNFPVFCHVLRTGMLSQVSHSWLGVISELP